MRTFPTNHFSPVYSYGNWQEAQFHGCTRALPIDGANSQCLLLLSITGQNSSRFNPVLGAEIELLRPKRLSQEDYRMQRSGCRASDQTYAWTRSCPSSMPMLEKRKLKRNQSGPSTRITTQPYSQLCPLHKQLGGRRKCRNGAAHAFRPNRPEPPGP